jgi:hypothetical protein
MQLPYHDARTKEQPVKLEEKISFTGIGWDNTLHWAATMGT